MSSNLHFIKSAKLTTTAGSINLEDCFNDIYDVYYVALRNFNSDGGANTLYLRFLDSSNAAINSGSLYNRAQLSLNSGSGFSEETDTGGDRITVGTVNPDTAGVMNAIIYVFNPYNSSRYTYVNFQSSCRELEARKGVGRLAQTSTIKGLQIKSDNSDNMTQGNIVVYGVE